MTFKIGLLGGIGPTASANFMVSLIKRIKATGIVQQNKDFPQIMLNSINASEILEKDDENIDTYIQGIQELDDYSPDILCMICNTIHLHYQVLSAHAVLSKNFIYLPSLVESYLVASEKDICILGTTNTLCNGLYEFPGVSYIAISQKIQYHINNAIFKYNKGTSYDQERKNIINEVNGINQNHEVLFLLGCTEIEGILGNYVKDFSYKNTIDFLLDHIIKEFVISKEASKKLQYEVISLH